jgi:serine/threonine protein phosphatase PrpC
VNMRQAFALTDRGCVRPNNEDYCRIDPHEGFYVLADGMGGARAGERASRLAVETVVDRLLSAPRRDSHTLLEAVEEAHKRVTETACSDPALEGMGTTLVAALDVGTEIAIASVGDSRAYIYGDHGLRTITDDQTWVNEVGRPLGLDENSLRTHPMRHVLTMAIGANAPLSINYYVVRPKPDEILLLCTDGLHGVVDPKRIEELLSQGGNLDTMCKRLVEAARAAGAPDNVTVVLVKSS